MTGRIGPHEGRELELMLAGRKRLAFFQDWVPEEDFAPHVASGRIVMARRQEAGWPFPHTYYALAEHAGLIDDLHRALVAARRATGEEWDALEYEIGALLGYTREDVEAFLARWRAMQRRRARRPG
jgi:hypothetical protein